MKVALIDQGDTYRHMPQRLRGVQPSKAAADNDHVV
jgi:hypothetical protein